MCTLAALLPRCILAICTAAGSSSSSPCCHVTIQALLAACGVCGWVLWCAQVAAVMLWAAHHSALLQLAATWPDHVPDTGCAAISTATQLRHWRWCEYWPQVAAEQLVDALDRQAAPVCMNPSVQEQQERKTACTTHLAHVPLQVPVLVAGLGGDLLMRGASCGCSNMVHS